MKTKEIRITMDADFHKRKEKIKTLTWKELLTLGLETAEKINNKGK